MYNMHKKIQEAIVMKQQVDKDLRKAAVKCFASGAGAISMVGFGAALCYGLTVSSKTDMDLLVGGFVAIQMFLGAGVFGMITKDNITDYKSIKEDQWLKAMRLKKLGQKQRQKD